MYKLKEFGKGLLFLFLGGVLLSEPVFASYLNEDINIGGIIPNIINFLPISGYLQENFILLSCEIASLVLVCFWFRKILLKDLHNLKNNWKKHLKTIIIYWIIGLGIMLLSNYVVSFLILDGNIAANEELNRELIFKYPFYAIATTTLITPIIEELIFKAGFRKAFDKKWTFLLFTTLFFASMHVLASLESFQTAKDLLNIFYLIPYGALGLSFGLIYVKTDNICAAIIAHMIHNAVTIGIVFLSL